MVGDDSQIFLVYLNTDVCYNFAIYFFKCGVLCVESVLGRQNMG